MADIIIDDVDSVNIKIACEKSIAKELSDFFTFYVPGHKFMPAYRNRMWDGQIKLYNMYKQQLYSGLLDYTIKFAEERNYSVENNTKSCGEAITLEQVTDFVKTLNITVSGKPIIPHKHQLESIHHSITNGRCLLLSPTGSGKSLIIYGLVRWYMNKLPKDKKILILVPTISLVSQMYSDFVDYAKHDNFDVHRNCHKIYGGQDKETPKQVIISTWQSIYQLPLSYFKQFSAVFGDECHLYKSKSLTDIMVKLKTCPYRIGTTGTLDGTLTHKLVIEGLFGLAHKVTTTKELMDKDILSNLSIDCILLKYPDVIRQQLKKITYQEEIDWIVQNKQRNQFITNLALSLKGNTLILFQFVEKHGKVLKEMLDKAQVDNRKIFFVYGGTEVEEREQVRAIIEDEENAIIVASYGVFSTGVSIRRLHNIVFSSPSKSRIRVLQSIGRQLRKSEFKENAKLYDLADDLSWKSYKNHTLRHYEDRLKIYDSELFAHRKISIPIV
jgi:superfamily II DNA or RNA helicase